MCQQHVFSYALTSFTSEAFRYILKSFCKNVLNNGESKKRLLSNIISTQWITADNIEKLQKDIFLKQ